MHYDTLLVSDVHLGCAVSLAADLLHLLQNTTFKRLILLGDIFQDLNFSRLTSEHWNLISYIRKLSNPKRNIEIIWVEGNHDAGIPEVMQHMLGIQVCKEYEWSWENKKCIAVHGHQYDNLWAQGTPVFGRIFTPIYLWAQEIYIFKKWLPKLMDKFHTHWERLDSKVAAGALRFGTRSASQFVFCGHTHQATHVVKGNVEYWNCGSWVGEFGTYITLGEDGVKLHEHRINHSHSSEK